MSRTFKKLAQRPRKGQSRNWRSLSQPSRHLRFEPLEDRRLLSITVDTLLDEADGSLVDGDISLRDAIALAPNGETIDFSVVGAINLTSLGQLVINKNLTISGPGAEQLTLRAYDPTPAVFNGDGSRVFLIEPLTASRAVSLSGLTLTGADVNSTTGGGAILSRADLSIQSSVISGNTVASGAGIYQIGYSLSIVDSELRGNFAWYGGGIKTSRSNVSIVRSSISGNTARFGGGLEAIYGTVSISQSSISGNKALGAPYSSGGGIFATNADLTVTNSTFDGNQAAIYGGAIDRRVGGDGHYSLNQGITLTGTTISGNSAKVAGGMMLSTRSGFEAALISDSTISGNVASTGPGGGIYCLEGLTKIFFSTITDNDAPGGAGSGVALRRTATAEVYSSIIAGNVHSDVDLAGPGTNIWQSHGYNVIGVGGGLSAFNQPGDQKMVFDPMLGPLADNGGPTKTHALLESSVALDAGNPSDVPEASGVPEADGRGLPFVRVAGDAIDVGAYERQSFPGSLVVDTLADELDYDFSAGDLSLREAIHLAHGFVGADTIVFDDALTSGGPAVLSLVGGELRIDDSVSIVGPGATMLTIDASGSDLTPETKNGDGIRIFYIDDGDVANVPTVEIRGLMLTGGDSSGSGGAIFNREDLSIAFCTISGNAANGLFNYGGGVANFDGQLSVHGTTISGNSALKGGGIGSRGALNVTDSTISGNSASADGGGIHSRAYLGGGLAANIINSTVSGNAASAGGGIYGQGMTSIRHSTITANTAISFGSGVASESTEGYTRTEVGGSIIAGNVGADADIPGASNTFQSNGYNLIGVGSAVGVFDQAGDQTGADPLLGPLEDNGGPTKTHAPLPPSSVIDAGDPSVVFNTAEFDQRGAPFLRVVDGNTVPGARIDIGAVERQSIPSAVYGDYNQDGTVNAADYTVWRNGLGTTDLTPYSGADGDGDGSIDIGDYGVWKRHFGEMVMPFGGGAVTSEPLLPSQSRQEVVPESLRFAESSVVESPMNASGQPVASRASRAFDVALLAWLVEREESQLARRSSPFDEPSISATSGPTKEITKRFAMHLFAGSKAVLKAKLRQP